MAGARTFADVGRLAVAAGRDGLLLGLPLEHGLLLRHLLPLFDRAVAAGYGVLRRGFPDFN